MLFVNLLSKSDEFNWIIDCFIAGTFHIEMTFCRNKLKTWQLQFIHLKNFIKISKVKDHHEELKLCFARESKTRFSAKINNNHVHFFSQISNQFYYIFCQSYITWIFSIHLFAYLNNKFLRRMKSVAMLRILILEFQLKYQIQGNANCCILL